ncbi:MAG: hypothetical protein CSA18_05340, partial [Deltaproteobacteria bacterium]
LEAIILPGPVPLPVPLPGPVKPMPVPSPLDWIRDHYNPDNWIVTAWRYWRKAIDDWLDGDECPEEDRCKEIKNQCIERCYPILESNRSPRWSDIPTNDFNKCVDLCMSENGC